MTLVDLARAVDWIETRWGSSKAWQRWEELFEDFATYTAGALKQALYEFYNAGHRYAPTPSELKKKISEVQRLRIERGDDPVSRVCLGDHVFAGPGPDDEDRHYYCVLCGERGPVFRCEHAFRSDGRCAWCPAVRESA